MAVRYFTDGRQVPLILPAVISWHRWSRWLPPLSPIDRFSSVEMLVASDPPSGVAIPLTDKRDVFVLTFATQVHLRELATVANLEERSALQIGVADRVSRFKLTHLDVPSTGIPTKFRNFMRSETISNAKSLGIRSESDSSSRGSNGNLNS